MIVSYAQNAEDVVLWRGLHGTSRGFYVDVGAAHPTYHSVTRLFYERGWRGVNVEPHPEFFALLCAERQRDVNLRLGVGAREGVLTYYEDPSLPGNSTFDGRLAEHYRAQGVELRERTVEVTTLAAICERHVEGSIDFLKIDAEGFEREVLAGADFQRFRPRVLVIEAVDPSTREPAASWEGDLAGSSYECVLYDGLNRFYVRAEDAHLAAALHTPANVLDEYEPFEQVELRRRAEGLAEELNEAKVRASALEQVLAEAQTRASALAGRVAASEAVVARTRAALASARAELNDARAELAAVRSALVGAPEDA